VKKFVGHGHWKDSFDAEKEIGDVLWYAASLATALDLDLSEIAEKNLIKLGVRYEKGFSTEASQARVDLEEEETDARSLRGIQFRKQPVRSLRFEDGGELSNFLWSMKELGATLLPSDDPAVPSKGWAITLPPHGKVAIHPDGDVTTPFPEVVLLPEITLSDLKKSIDPNSRFSTQQWAELLDSFPTTPGLPKPALDSE